MEQLHQARGATRLPPGLVGASRLGVAGGALQVRGVLDGDDAGEVGVHGDLLVLGGG